MASAAGAWAQPASDTVENFVAAFATPTPTTGKVARWRDGICPLTVGQQPAVTQFVTQRVKEVAALAGVPVNASPTCTANIEIVFTTLPQQLLDSVRKRQKEYLGYAENNAEREKLATVTRRVQAWYTTQTTDLRGRSQIDSAGSGLNKNFSDAILAGVTGNHINDGVRSDFNHIIIVADINGLKAYEAGPIADYIAMLALAQLGSLDTCQPLSSIENMLAKGCEATTGKLTENDIAYLRGLYKMSADRNLLAGQRNEIAGTMKAALAAR
jgi:hypothetical protein